MSAAAAAAVAGLLLLLLQLVAPSLEVHNTSLLSFYRATAMLSTVYAVVVVCVCVSVTLRYCIKTAKRRITQTTPHDSPMTLVF